MYINISHKVFITAYVLLTDIYYNLLFADKINLLVMTSPIALNKTTEIFINMNDSMGGVGMPKLGGIEHPSLDFTVIF